MNLARPATPVLLAGILLVAGLLLSACERTPPRKVVLVGGADSEGPGRHDYPHGIRALQALLQQDPETRDRIDVAAYPDGWPVDPHAFDGASAVLWYFDGMDKHPLRDPVKRAAFEALMRRGVGVVALHQASTVPTDDDLGLPRWLGGARAGMFDRTTEWVELKSKAHAITQGIGEFGYRDEFYPTFRFSTQGGMRAPLLEAVLHPQFRDGKAVLDDKTETTDVAWAFEREGGGRSVVYSGGHFLAALDQPGVRRLLRNAVLWTAGLDVPDDRSALAAPPTKATATGANGQPRATFHVDAGRSGWRRDERVLAPAGINERDFGLAWESPQLDAFDGQPPRLYASPLYLERLAFAAGPYRGETLPVVIAASSNGYVYAVNAARHGDLAPGRILWRKRLGEPCRLQPAPLDGVPTGILSTPIADPAANRLYVTHCDPQRRWQAYALELDSGEVLPGWPVRLDEATFNRFNANAGPEPVPAKRKFDFRVQRGALNLSPDGSRLYVVFGETETGWLASVDTRNAKVDSAFAAVAMPHRGSGGIWGAGGPAVDGQGSVYVATGSGFDGYQDSPHDWTQSVLKLAPPGAKGFVLQGTYTPFNYCTTAKNDIDLGSGGVLLLPDAHDNQSPRLLAIGGKQGNLYLLDRDRLPGKLDLRPPCSADASNDGSLLPPQAQAQFGTRGPLSVFGPYSEEDAALDLARARSLPAAFRDERGVDYLFATGNSKRTRGSADSVPPSVVRVEVVRAPGRPPYLRLDRSNRSLVLGNPGSPVVTSDGSRNAIVWILDENAPRSALLAGDDVPRPVLYALDASTLDVLWRSAPGELFTSGKYNEPAFGGGQVFVGTDRIQAFGQGGQRLANRERAPAPASRSTNMQAQVTGLGAADIYKQRCSMCHDHPQGNIPPRATLATRDRQRIVDALSIGAMKVQAQGLNQEQIEAMARYLKQ